MEMSDSRHVDDLQVIVVGAALKAQRKSGGSYQTTVLFKYSSCQLRYQQQIDLEDKTPRGYLAASLEGILNIEANYTRHGSG